jgi:phage tail sheath protein FI
MQGVARTDVSDGYLAGELAKICESRMDAIAFASPPKNKVLTLNNTLNISAREDVISWADSVLTNAGDARVQSYLVLDSGYKYRYDRYNDRYIYTPLNGDIAGLCARTDELRDPWFSPAGYNRGGIKNIIKLAYNPVKTDRDELYKASVNPVITQPGQGTVLFGDKTAVRTASAFDRINVRRLFIVLEKAITRASRSTLFEFNDEFTRAQFRNLIEPFLRDIQGRRGIYDYKVVCDETNNTPEIIDRNEFVGDIYIKPARAINFIRLNFVAVRTGVEFEEIIGQR